MSTITLIDSHAHLTDPRLVSETEDILLRAREAGVGAVVTIASNAGDSERTVALAAAYEGVYATVGIHPHEASTATPEALAEVRDLATRPGVVGIGETGLDFYYDNAPRDAQYASFRAQLKLARELDLPVIVHARSADDEVVSVIREAGWGRGILHCFSGGAALLEAVLELGWYVSFSGVITFPKWDGKELLRSVPLNRLLVETDSPYLAPVPFRGKTNEPGHVRQVAERAAELRGESFEVLAAATAANTRAVYRIG
ncbi:MAG: TatD family hydrolase [Gemmatimonadota bacterium]|jgi:TatD DNase family protein|nr:TatD family hydrolase [Gemmatimonadota bacterium]